MTKTFRYVDRSFQGMGVRREAKGWSNTISKKILLGQKAGFLYNTKIVLQETCNITTFIILTFKVLQKFIFLDFIERLKFHVVIFFYQSCLEGTFTTNGSLVLLTKIHTNWKNLKVFVSAITTASITTAAFTTKILNVNFNSLITSPWFNEVFMRVQKTKINGGRLS